MGCVLAKDRIEKTFQVSFKCFCNFFEQRNCDIFTLRKYTRYGIKIDT
jgi:hypothetical protein